MISSSGLEPALSGRGCGWIAGQWIERDGGQRVLDPGAQAAQPRSLVAPFRRFGLRPTETLLLDWQEQTQTQVQIQAQVSGRITGRMTVGH